MSGIRMESKILNLDPVLEEIRNCGGNVNKSVKGSIRLGLKVIRNEAEARANALSAKPGKKTKLKVRMRKGAAVGSLFPAKGHAELRLVEYGTKAGRRWAKKGKFVFYAGKRRIETKSIQHPGTVARSWLRSAFDAKATEAIDATGDALLAAAEEARIEAEGEDE